MFDLLGISFQNPVLAASGTYAYGVEFETLVDLNCVGGIVVKGLSREAIHGNASPRLFETPAGMMNSVGLQNIGARAFVQMKLPQLRKYATPIIANIFGYTEDDYIEVVRILNDAVGLSAYELNVSCPNTKHGGIAFGVDCGMLSALVAKVKAVARRPVIVKLSPNVATIEPLAKAAEQSGADAISLINTIVGLAIDTGTRSPRIAAGYAGVSGAAIKPIALRMVQQAARVVKIPVIGLGGISTGEDAAEFLMAGASLVQVGTANFWDPASPVRVAQELDAMLPRLGVASAWDLTGSLRI